MAQYHYVVYYDTADERWHIESDTEAYFPDGEVFDYAGSYFWEPLPDAEVEWYQRAGDRLLEVANLYAQYAYET